MNRYPVWYHVLIPDEADAETYASLSVLTVTWQSAPFIEETLVELTESDNDGSAVGTAVGVEVGVAVGVGDGVAVAVGVGAAVGVEDAEGIAEALACACSCPRVLK